MSQSFSVSVIIPVYNAANYVVSAVNSVIQLVEVKEIILVEDGSPDHALSICKELEAKFEKVRVYQHPDGLNEGAGASRNLGVKKATCEFIAFLDADDLYLPNHFDKAAQVFLSQPDTDGVYGAAGFIENDKVIPNKLYTIRKPVQPDDLFAALVRGTYGHFTTIGITLRRSVFEKVGYFNTALRLGQDADLWLRLAYHCKLRAGELAAPIALIRRHPENRVRSIDDKVRIVGLQTSISYFKRQDVAFNDYLVLVAKLFKIYFKHKMFASMLRDLPLLLKI
ncbi:glycosyltransferase family 2 protein [Chryseolinea sp. H1M3-3]|uniref:glycosyltransferase family 2 protein n=1 Tax=Chryseolinea sp. H1M3-3 TaxID=3034144 RepID=UPI0023EBB8CF|nr:glycosyltransferase family 2 protein [Chryseolinea sp. H1M3-3]